MKRLLDTFKGYFAKRQSTLIDLTPLLQMDFKAVLAWLEEEAKTTRIHEVTDILLEKLTEKMEFLAVIFYDMEDDPTVENLQVGQLRKEVMEHKTGSSKDI